MLFLITVYLSDANHSIGFSPISSHFGDNDSEL